MTAFFLRLIALGSMLIDHIYVALLPTQLWMNCIGRLAFPIFAFQLTEGYRQTGHKKNYALRLFLFAFLSEVPFDLMAYETPFYWGHQNVLWTLLLGLLTVWSADLILTRWQDDSIRFTSVFFIVFTAFLTATLLCLDYGGPGILMIFTLYILRNRAWGIQTLCVMCIHILMGGPTFTIWDIQFPIQIFGTISMIPIGCYAGKQGHHSKAWSLFCYAFYPLHLLILYLI